MLLAREALRVELAVMHQQLLAFVCDDATFQRLMTAHGVGTVTAATFTSAVEDPGNFAKSKSVAHILGVSVAAMAWAELH